jgi:hypothetical protein
MAGYVYRIMDFEGLENLGSILRSISAPTADVTPRCVGSPVSQEKRDSERLSLSNIMSWYAESEAARESHTSWAAKKAVVARVTIFLGQVVASMIKCNRAIVMACDKNE